MRFFKWKIITDREYKRLFLNNKRMRNYIEYNHYFYKYPFLEPLFQWIENCGEIHSAKFEFENRLSDYLKEKGC